MSNTVSIRTHIRWMIRRDMMEVLAIDAATFGADYWIEDDFLRFLRQRNGIGMVSEIGDVVVGYSLYELHSLHVELVRFAVSPKWQRQGIGSAIVGKIMSKLSSHRRQSMKVTVPDDALPAQLLLRDMGFRAYGMVRGLAEYGDTYRMRYEVAEDVA